MTTFATWKRIMSYMRPYRWFAIVAFMGVIGSTALQIAIPTILRDVIDIGIQRSDADYMLAAGFLIIGLGLLRGLAGFLFRFFGERMSHHIAYDIRNEVYDKVQNLSFSYHNQAQTGNLITRAISDVNEMQRYFAFGLVDGLNTLFLTTGIIIVMLYTSPLLTIIAISPLLPLAFLSKRFAEQVDPRWKAIMERTQTLSAHLQENVVGAQVVRAFAREDFEQDKFADENELLFHDFMGLINKWSTYIPTSGFLVATSTAIVLIVGGMMQQSGYAGITIGTIVQFNAFILMMAQPLRFLGFIILLTTQAISSGTRVFEIIDEDVRIQDKPDAIDMPEIQGVVKFDNVAFQYDDGNANALRNINLEAKPDQIIALLGQTGSGKTTLVNLIPRFFDVTKGKVTIDGHDVRDVTLRSLRHQIGFVLQDSLLFSATIRENIAYGTPEATMEDVEKAARAANAHDFILEFPDGYETEIGERGVTLSGGQRQRVAIARALLIDPRILILDDSTSAVDTKTEFEIQEALNELMKGRTTFIIAQRLNTVKDADQIFVLKDGEIAESGQHDALLERDGLYAEIYRLQLADQERLKNELIALGGLVDDIEHKKYETGEFNKSEIGEFSGD